MIELRVGMPELPRVGDRCCLLHLREVHPRTEHRAGRIEDNAAQVLPCGDLQNRTVQFPQHLARQSVAFLRTVEGQPRDAAGSS